MSPENLLVLETKKVLHTHRHTQTHTHQDTAKGHTHTHTHTHTGYSKGSKGHRSMLKELPWPKPDNLSKKRSKVVLGYNLKYKISMSLY